MKGLNRNTVSLSKNTGNIKIAVRKNLIQETGSCGKNESWRCFDFSRLVELYMFLAGPKKKKKKKESCMQLFKKNMIQQKLFLICGRVEEILCFLVVTNF